MVTEKQKENLKRCSPQEAREYGKKGGKKRAENIKKRKCLKEELLALLSIEQQNGKTIQENWVIALAKNLLRGDVRTSVFVRDTIGEKPTELVELDTPLNRVEIAFVDKSVPDTATDSDPKIVGGNSPIVGDKNAR